MPTVSTGLTILSVALFLGSLTRDGYYIEGANPRAWANTLGLLLIGWVGVFTGAYAWLANPALVAAWVLVRFPSRRGVALGCAIVALGFALSFLLQKRILRDEAGNYARVTGRGAGYWMWVASCAVAVVACVV